MYAFKKHVASQQLGPMGVTHQKGFVIKYVGTKTSVDSVVGSMQGPML
jgi:hypothetical protein